jgi:hypothetical protein
VQRKKWHVAMTITLLGIMVGIGFAGGLLVNNASWMFIDHGKFVGIVTERGLMGETPFVSVEIPNVGSVKVQVGSDELEKIAEGDQMELHLGRHRLHSTTRYVRILRVIRPQPGPEV